MTSLAFTATLAVTFVLFLGWPAVAPAQTDDLPPAEELLARFEAKARDAKALAGLRNIVARGTVRAGDAFGGSIEEVHAGRTRAKVTMTCEGMGTSTMGTTGEASWSTDPVMGVTIREGAEQAPVVRQFGIFRGRTWRELYAKAETVRRTELAGRPHFEILMRPERGAPDTWYVDAETFLLSRVDTEVPDPLGGTLKMQLLFADWKPVAGVLFPHERRQRVGTMEIVTSFTEIASKPDLPAAAVAPPEDVVRALQDPDRRSRAAGEAGTFAVETLEARPVASIRVKIKPAEISKSLAVLLPEVMRHLGKIGVSPAGPPFSRYHAFSEQEIDLEAGIPVQKPIEGEGRVQPSELPGGRSAVTWHVGPYDKLSETHERFERWLGEQHLEPRGPVYELYWTDPGLEPDPAKWRTQIVRPVK